MFDKTLGLFDDHFSDLNVAHSRFIEGGGNDFALHRTLHVRHFFRTFIDQQHDQIAFRMIGRDRMGDVLEKNRLTRARRRDDEATLTFAERRHNVDEARRAILQSRIGHFHLEFFVRIKRRQIIKVDLVARLVGALEINRRNLQQREIAFTVFRRADLAFHRVACAQRKAPDLRRGDIDIVGTRQIVCFRRTQEAETVRQHFNDAFADNVDALLGILFEDREHHVLGAERRSVFHFKLFGNRQKFGRPFGLEVLQFDLRHR